LVAVRGEQLPLSLGGTRSHGYAVEGRVVGVLGTDGAEEVGNAEASVGALAGEGEAHPLGSTVFVGPDDDVVTLRVHGEVTPHDRGDQGVLCLGERKLFAPDGPHSLLELGVGFGTAVSLP